MKYLVAALLLAACGDPAVEVELDLHEPASTVELLPGGTVDFSWTITGGDGNLEITVARVTTTETDTIFNEHQDEGDGAIAWEGFDVSGNLVPPAVYDLEATLSVDDVPVDSAVRNLSVHGVYFTAPEPDGELTIAGSALPVDLHYVTVSQRVIHLYTYLVPAAGPEIEIDDRTIPGEFVPFSRDIHFMGVDTDGVAVPAGDYTAVVDVADDDDPSLAYRSTGGVVHWLPGS